jgi:hypothetical protein
VNGRSDFVIECPTPNPPFRSAGFGMTPRQQATAFRIWQFANARGWDCTAAEIGEALDMSASSVATFCVYRGWNGRLRSSERAARWSDRLGSYAADLAITEPLRMKADDL